MEELCKNTTFSDIYFLDYDIVRIVYIYLLGYNVVKIVTDFNLPKQISFWPGQTHIPLSRLNTYDNNFGVGEFKKSELKWNRAAWLGFEHVKQTFFFQNKNKYFLWQYSHNSFS